MAEEGFYNYKENRTITLPSASASIAIEKREWERLKSTVNKCKGENQWFMSIAFCFFGIAGSAFVTWISLYSQENLETIRLFLLITTIVSVIIGGAFIAFQLYINSEYKSSLSSIKDEIQFIEDGIRKEVAS